jgi:hypothetical protein
MPLDTNLLYGEMAGSWLTHMAIPVGVSVLLSTLPYTPLKTKVLMLIGISALLSFFVQFGFMAFLQASSCTGVKSYQTIAASALVGAVLTAAMMAIPAFFEPMRLIVSNLFMEHKALLTSTMAKKEEIITEAGREVRELDQTGGALTYIDYEEQEFKETMIGTSYWAAFAGAYGVGIGSMIAGKCPAVA